MVDIGLYAITPYQFRLAHDIGLENFISPSDEHGDTTPTDSNGHNYPNNLLQAHSYETQNRQRNGVCTPKISPPKGPGGFKSKGVEGIESGIFTLTLERRPEKRERSRSGSDAISPEPKRIGPIANDVTIIEEPRGEYDDGSVSPATTSEASCCSASHNKCSSDTDEVFERPQVIPSGFRDVDASAVASCSYATSVSGYVETGRRRHSPDNSGVEDQPHDRATVVRRKRRPRKLPQIPANAQRKSVATLMHAHSGSIADELVDAEPQQWRNERALKAMSWAESKARTSSTNSSQDSGSFSHGYQSLDDLGSPEDVDSIHMEFVEKCMKERDMMESRGCAMSRSQTRESNMVRSSQEATPTGEVPNSFMTSSMSMSLMEELQSEGVKINEELGSTFCDHSEYIDDDMPKLKRFFGEDSGVKFQPNPMPSTSRVRAHSSTMVNQHTEDSSPEERHVRKSSKSRSRMRHLSAASNSSRRDRGSTSSCYSGDLEALDATHRGCHKFIPRHSDELFIEIGDLVSVTNEADDLWCDGVNLRTGKRGIFPAAYATDLSILEDHDGPSKFKLRFLGSVEVSQHKGNDVICTAIQKVVMSRTMSLNNEKPPLYCVQINEYGIKMMDLSKKKPTPKRSSIRERLAKILNKEIVEEKDTDHFFTLKNVSFCGYHPRNERYFAFITKHPTDLKFACHVFLSERSTVPICEAVGSAFRRFYQEYMAFAHPTEDIYLE